jgi:hypothetical protein
MQDSGPEEGVHVCHDTLLLNLDDVRLSTVLDELPVVTADLDLIAYAVDGLVQFPSDEVVSGDIRFEVSFDLSRGSILPRLKQYPKLLRPPRDHTKPLKPRHSTPPSVSSVRSLPGRLPRQPHPSVIQAVASPLELVVARQERW